MKTSTSIAKIRHQVLGVTLIAAFIAGCGRQAETLSQDALVQTAMVFALSTLQHTTSTQGVTSASETPLPSATPTSSTCYSGVPEVATVVEVVDGDTIQVQKDGQVFTVRYIGMDASDEPGANPGTQGNTELVSGKEVTLYKDESETDDFGRLLRYVIVNGVFVNLELVKRGLAIAASYPPDTACDTELAAADAQARTLQYGMWQPTETSHPGTTKSAIAIIAMNKREEWVDIQNIGGAAQSLDGWTLVSERGNQTCWLSGSIAAGETLRIWAFSSPTGFSCGFGTNIWNNSEVDPAVLYDAQGKQVSRYQ
jgi:endonuclease YncB( thermonuclease family)